MKKTIGFKKEQTTKVNPRIIEIENKIFGEYSDINKTFWDETIPVTKSFNVDLILSPEEYEEKKHLLNNEINSVLSSLYHKYMNNTKSMVKSGISARENPFRGRGDFLAQYDGILFEKKKESGGNFYYPTDLGLKLYGYNEYIDGWEYIDKIPDLREENGDFNKVFFNEVLNPFIEINGEKIYVSYDHHKYGNIGAGVSKTKNWVISKYLKDDSNLINPVKLDDFYNLAEQVEEKGKNTPTKEQKKEAITKVKGNFKKIIDNIPKANISLLPVAKTSSYKGNEKIHFITRSDIGVSIIEISQREITALQKEYGVDIDFRYCEEDLLKPIYEIPLYIFKDNKLMMVIAKQITKDIPLKHPAIRATNNNVKKIDKLVNVIHYFKRHIK